MGAAVACTAELREVKSVGLRLNGEGKDTRTVALHLQGIEYDFFRYVDVTTYLVYVTEGYTLKNFSLFTCKQSNHACFSLVIHVLITGVDFSVELPVVRY